MGRLVIVFLLWSLGAVAAAAGAERTVDFYNWSDYIDPAVLEQFHQETGITVHYDTYDSNDILETKLLAGNSGYDVVVPTAYFLQRQIRAGIFYKLDKSKLSNLVNVWDEIAKRLAVYDPGNQYAVNYMWGTVGIGYNAGKVKQILGPQALISSWDVVFKPDILGQFKDCGVHMLDSSDDMLTLALRYLGLDPNSTSRADLEKAANLLIAVRPFVRKFHSSEYLNALASGEICLVVGFSGDIKQAQNRAKEAHNGVDIGYVIPKEGTQLWFDNLAIPRDAKHIDEAHELINFLLRPQIAAKNTNFISYANGVATSRPFVNPTILNDANIYPDQATMDRFFTIGVHDASTTRFMNRLWIRIKTGH